MVAMHTRQAPGRVLAPRPFVYVRGSKWQETTIPFDGIHRPSSMMHGCVVVRILCGIIGISGSADRE